MALRPLTTRRCLHWTQNLNDRVKNFVDGNYLLSDMTVSNVSNNTLTIEDLNLNLNGILVHIDSAELQFDTATLSTPYSIYVRCDHNYNNPYETLITYDDMSSASAYGSAINLNLSSNKIEGLASIGFDKTSTSSTAGIIEDSATIISDYYGIGSKVYIPSSDVSNINSISIILDESNNLTTYRKYDKSSNILPGWNTLLFNLDDADSTYGSISGTFFQRAIVVIETVDSTTEITNLAIDRLFGIYEDPNDKIYDDEIDFYISDESCGDFAIATYDGSAWSYPENLSLLQSSLIINNHINTDFTHIPNGLYEILYVSNLTPSDTLITMADRTGAETDYTASNESCLKPIQRTISDPRIGVISLYDTIYLKAEYLRKNSWDNIPAGVSGFISDTSSTSVPGYGCYYSDSSDTKIVTNTFLSIPGEVSEITVDAMHLDNDSSGITYDIYINDTSVRSGCLLNHTYSLSSDYTSLDLTGTDMVLEFHIPAISGGDYWITKSSNIFAAKGNRLISVDDRFILSLINSYLFNYLYSRDSWRSLAQPSIVHDYLKPHPASRSDGLRIIPRISSEGGIYKIANNSWISISNGQSYYGRPIDIDYNEFYNVDSTATLRFNDQANYTLSLAGPGDGFKFGAGFRGQSNKIYIHGGESLSSPPYTNILKYLNLSSGAWASGASSSVNHAFQGYSQLNTKKIYSLCGLSDSTTYVGNVDEYNESTSSWSSKTSKTIAVKSPSSGISQNDTIIVSNGELSSTNNTAEVYEYVPNLALKFFGFAAKLKYSTLYGNAGHVGYWADDTASYFTLSPQSEKEVTGYWTQDNGEIFGGEGTWWGYYMIWADSSAPDYTSATFDEKWQNGFWSDSNGYIGSDQGPLWDK